MSLDDRRIRSACAFALLACAALHAQAPVITPNGDPSVRNDTVYRLALDPHESTSHAYVLLLDDGVVRFDRDGRGVRTYRQVVHLLTPESVRQWGELRQEYEQGAERFALNWVRVLDPQGHVVREGGALETETNARLGSLGRADSSAVTHRISVSGLQVGMILDYSYTIEMVVARRHPCFCTRWRVTSGAPVRRSRFLVDLPWDAEPRVVERHLSFQRSERVEGDRRVYLWATQEVPVEEREPFAPDSSYGATVAIGVPLRWIDISKAFARYLTFTDAWRAPEPSELRDALAGAATRTDTLHRLYDWSASQRDGRSGAGPGRPRLDTSAVCDCSAKLFVAAARSLGISAFPVLVSAQVDVDTAVPSFQMFTNVIAAVEVGEDRFEFFDPSADRIPFGELPPYEEGRFGLLVRDDGEYTRVSLPSPKPAALRVAFSFRGSLAADGSLVGDWTIGATGARRYAFRALLASGSLPDTLASAGCASSIVDSLRARADTLVAGNAPDRSADARLVRHSCAHATLTDAGGFVVFELPLLDLANVELARVVETWGPRTMPIDAGKVSGRFDFVEQLRLRLPPGWRARLPNSIQSASDFGTYEATYAQVGDELRVTRRWLGATGVYTASRFSDLKAWLNEKAQDDVKVLVLDK